MYIKSQFANAKTDFDRDVLSLGRVNLFKNVKVLKSLSRLGQKTIVNFIKILFILVKLFNKKVFRDI